jgi:hypothetical protein
MRLQAILLPTYMGCLMKFYMIIYESVFQNTLILCRKSVFFPEQSTLAIALLFLGMACSLLLLRQF